MTRKTRPKERHGLIVSAGLRREQGQPLDADEQAAADELLRAIAWGKDPNAWLGVKRERAGNPIDPESQAAQIREVIATLLETCARDRVSVHRASEILEAAHYSAPDPKAQYRGRATRRVGLSAKRLRAIWREYATAADRKLADTLRENTLRKK